MKKSPITCNDIPNPKRLARLVRKMRRDRTTLVLRVKEDKILQDGVVIPMTIVWCAKYFNQIHVRMNDGTIKALKDRSDKYPMIYLSDPEPVAME